MTQERNSTLVRAGLAAALVFFMAAGSAMAASGGGGGGGSSGGSDAHPCPGGKVWNGVKCVTKNSENIPDKQLYEQGRALALAGYYGNALDALTSVRNKDAMTLTMIGYSHRKMGDVTTGFDYYKQALAIEPDNLNTHEYMGEGYVAMGKMDEAKLELATLQKLCGGEGCEQYDDLAKAIAGEPDND